MELCGPAFGLQFWIWLRRIRIVLLQGHAVYGLRFRSKVSSIAAWYNSKELADIKSKRPNVL